MKSTWVVYVAAGNGNEFCNCITEAEWYGPFTQADAEKLEKKVNAFIAKLRKGECEPEEAVAMPLINMVPRDALRSIKSDLQGTRQ